MEVEIFEKSGQERPQCERGLLERHEPAMGISEEEHYRQRISKCKGPEAFVALDS